MRQSAFIAGELVVLSLACSESDSNGSSGSGARPEAGAAGRAGNGASDAGVGAGAAGAVSGDAGGGAASGTANGSAGAASGEAGAGGASVAAAGDGGASASGGGGASGEAGANAGAGSGSGGAAGADCRTTGCTDGRECLSRPGSCDAGFACWNPAAIDCTERPVCGCDGQIYASRCAALEAGTWVGPASACAPPPGRNPCVSEFCDRESEYCEVTDFVTNPFRVCSLEEPYTTGRCVAIPEECRQAPDCGCMLPCRYPGGSCDDLPLTRFCMDGCVG